MKKGGGMVLIRNKLSQRLIVNLDGGRTIDILAKGAADVSDKELSSPHLQTLVTKGDIVALCHAAGSAKAPEKHVTKKQGSKKNTGK